MSDIDAKEAELRRINEELDREFSSATKRKPATPAYSAKEEPLQEEIKVPEEPEILGV